MHTLKLSKQDSRGTPINSNTTGRNTTWGVFKAYVFFSIIYLFFVMALISHGIIQFTTQKQKPQESLQLRTIKTGLILQ